MKQLIQCIKEQAWPVTSPQEADSSVSLSFVGWHVKVRVPHSCDARLAHYIEAPLACRVQDNVP